MSSKTTEPYNNAGMLDGSVGIKQAGSHDSRARISKTPNHFSKPQRLHHLDILVEQENEIASSEPDPFVDRARKVEWLGLDLYNRRGVAACVRTVKIVDARIRCPIVDHDNFHIRVIRLCLKIRK